MPIVPQSEIQVKFLEENFKETDERRGEVLAKFSTDFRPLISIEIGHKKFHTNSSTHQDLKFHMAEPKLFHSNTLYSTKEMWSERSCSKAAGSSVKSLSWSRGGGGGGDLPVPGIH